MVCSLLLLIGCRWKLSVEAARQLNRATSGDGLTGDCVAVAGDAHGEPVALL
jgi:hypothetical protein